MMRTRHVYSCIVGLWMLGLCCTEAQVIINEIHYDPEPDTAAIEFIELFNGGTTSVDLSGWYFSDGIEYTMPVGSSIAAGGYLVIAQNPTAIDSTFGVPALGPWNGKLSNDGEKIVLRDALDAKVDTLDYQRGFPWPVCPEGRSMELLNPNLDNDLGGSWRSSGVLAGDPETVYIAASSIDWRYFKGTEEASSPVTAWRVAAFDDAGWSIGQTSIGYGDDDDNTTLSDMRYNYTTVYLRKTFELEASEIPSSLLLRVYVDDGAVVWINGVEVARLHAPSGDLAFDATGVNHDAGWEEVVVSGSALTAGTNVVAVHALNQKASSSDLSIDLELRSNLTGGSLLSSPGEQNGVWTTSVPPAPRQVDHVPEQPVSGEAVVVSMKVTSPEGIGAVTLEYQQVAPGAYVRTTDAAYNAGWLALAMTDDGTGGDAVAGDAVYSATIPAAIQLHRHLIRYRITVLDGNGVSQQVPYKDDDRRNFAYFVYDGVPAWTGANEPGVTPPQTFSTNLMANALPIYQLLATEDDVQKCQYNSTYADIRFYGTLVYDGRVYDHIQFRVRGDWSTYKSGKNKWRFYFNTADDLEARDNYGEKYANKIRRLNFNACASPWVPGNRGMAGLDEAGSFRLYQLAGVLTPNTFYTQLRVIDAADEAPSGDQYAGDLWGLYLALEHIDGRFLAERDLPDGNTYKIHKLGHVQRNQSATQVDDESDLSTFFSSIGGNSVADWRTCLDLDSYYSFRGINRIVSHTDLRWNGNHAMYHHPDGHWSVIPQDLDAMFAPKVAQSGIVAMASCLNYATLELEKKNRCRELLDLLFSDDSSTGGQAVQVFHELSQWVNPPGESQTFADVDQFMWNYHPRASTRDPIHRGQFYVTPKSDGSWTRTLETADFEGFVKYITDFITDTDPDGFTVDDGDQRGYGFNYLELEAADSNIPIPPVLSYTGTDGYPVDALQFTGSAFDDPQGSGTFGALEWRIARIRNPSTPDYLLGERWTYEIDAVWESGELLTQDYSMEPPVDLVAGNTYRVRVRYKDSTERWSHWSDPVQFVAMGVDVPKNLILTEVHYNPANPDDGSTTDNDDFEFVELQNTGTTPLNLRGYALDGGIEFSFRNGAVDTLAPGAYVVVARDLAAFTSRYETNGMHLAGAYSGKLSNSGENIRLEFYGQKLWDISYNDARGWPLAPDGGGPSLIPLTDAINKQGFDIFDHPSGWRASTTVHGSPGAADPEPVAALLINEVVAHTDTGNDAPYDSNDQIELYNPTDTPIPLDGDWYLSDDFDRPELWNIPSNTVILAGGWLVFYEDDFHSDRVEGFGLNKAGDTVVLSHRPAGGPYRIVDSLEFEGQANGASWGRYPDGNAYFQTLEPTGGSSNQLAAAGVRFEQVMYHPLPINELETDAQLEYILIKNRSTQTILLEDIVDDAGPWRIGGGVEYTFEPNTTLAAGESLWLVPFNPLIDTVSKTLFCSTYGLDAGSVRLLGPYVGLLNNSGERISMERPQASDDPLNPNDISWVIIDEVYWSDESPWPESADQSGAALLRIGVCGNDPLNWTTTDDADSDGMPDPWETNFFGAIDAANGEAAADWDNDGSSNQDEYKAGTNPTNSGSVFAIQSLDVSPNNVVTWSSATGKVYSLWISTNLTFGEFTLTNSAILATPPLNTYTTGMDEVECVFYRITVEDE